ncbi:leucine-rich repeat and transmembrane domain-containing protein 2-like [Octopus vulgaris]|uniref:Leucine-rich repeat and transmembrane domain-containing protein 2-like n=1 Tax=Octopus vulgaris TaxID=6645 RepID=A0AA36BXU1_OCTVU|nr:leucine-rich repeat and transmembrane domain-containing protein 2-like [Octopus vulgaris]
MRDDTVITEINLRLKMFREEIYFKLTFVMILYMRLFSEAHAVSNICTKCICNEGEIYCGFLKLTSVPNETIPINVQILNLNGNNITNIAERAFENLSSLEILSLNNNQIKEITERTLRNLTNLKELDLQDNAIRSIEERTFHGHTKLEQLEMKTNKISNIKKGNFQNHTRLSHLDLSHNNITDFEEGTFEKFYRLWKFDFSKWFVYRNCCEETISRKTSSIKLLSYDVGIKEFLHLVHQQNCSCSTA